MKNSKYFLSFILIFFLGKGGVQAQVQEDMRSMSQGTEPALVITIPGMDEKIVTDVWKEYIKDFYKGKTKWLRKEKEWMTDDVSIVAVGGSNTVDLYAVANQAGNDVEFSVWFDLGGAFLSSRSHPDRFEEAEKMMMRFGKEVSKASVALELDNQAKELKKLEAELKKLESANERYHKEIEKAKEIIKKAESDIIQNEQDQKAAAANIEKQKEVVEAVKKRLKDF